MKKSTVAVVWLISLVVVFLLGLVPEHMRNQHLSEQVADARRQQADALERARFLSLFDPAAMAYLQTAQKNYGVAVQYSSRFFDQVRSTLDQTSEPELKSALQTLLNARDGITAQLAQGNPAVLSAWEQALLTLHGAASKMPQ